jgi:hypothetical protein
MMSDLFKKTSGILDSSQEAIQNATFATAHLKSVSAKTDSGQGTVGELVNDNALYNSLEQTTTTLHDTMLHAQAGVTDFQENMEALKHNFLLSGYFKKRGYEDSAELHEDEITRLPSGTAVKTFTYSSQAIFDGHESAKLKNQKSLDDVGRFLAQNPFGIAVIVVSDGMKGDTQKELVLTQAEAMVIREYLVANFGFDDSQLKTLGIGKQTGVGAEASGGTLQVLIFPPGTKIPPNMPSPAGIASKTTRNPIPVPAVEAPKLYQRGVHISHPSARNQRQMQYEETEYTKIRSAVLILAASIAYR